MEFYAQEERKAVMQYAEKDEKGNPVILTDGRLKLVDAEAKVAFDETIAKLNDTEVDGIERIVIRENDFASSADYPTPNDMALLDCIIAFEE